jgi:PAS domain S-box-containing protein
MDNGQYNKNVQEKSIYQAFMQSPVAIAILKGKEYVIEFANEFYLKILGKDKSIISKSLFTAFPELVSQGLKEFMDNVVKNKVAQHIAEHEFLIVKNGISKQCFFNCDYQPLKNDDGKVAGLIVIFTEVTEQVTTKITNLNNQNKLIDALRIANTELTYQAGEKGKRAAELIIANKELNFQTIEKKNRADELVIANEELDFQTTEKKNRADELIIANKELYFQTTEKKNRAAELFIANKELDFQTTEKKNRAAELIIANVELDFQNSEKENRAAELVIANKELLFQIKEKEKRAAELIVANYARSLIEASLDPLVTINTDGKITDMNEAMVGIADVPRGQLTGSNFFNYFTDVKKAKQVYEDVFTNGFIVDYPLTLKDGKLIDVLFNGSIFKDDNGYIQGAVLVGRDITEQKKIEKELTEAKLFAELATSIAEEEKLKALAAAHVSEDAVKSKQQFLSNMSHEIRTPMNAIIGFTKVILKTELSVKQKEYLTAIKMSGDALIVLINDILDLAKVDAGKMTFEQTPFKMALSVNAMLHLFDTKMQEKNLQLVKKYDTEIPAVLVGDPARLHQIILNLISNAVKFTTKGKITVNVKLLHQNEEKATVEFTITDTGIGIPENKLTKIFDNFQQASRDTSRLYGGTGLGLAIVKNLVEAQGGNIKVKSKINEGTAFSFVLDFKKTKAEVLADTEIMELDREIKDIKVLVVEDMALNQLLMKTLLDDFGFERDIVNNGKLAIEKLKAKAYDIILMDLQMPEMNGFETTEYIRKTMQSKIPIIALTADVTTVDLEKCKAAGMDDYIAKPVDERLLYSKIVGLTKKPVVIVSKEMLIEAIEENKLIKCIDLKYLNQRTKSNPVLMMEMIALYLEQTPPLINLMKKSFINKDWVSLHSAVHKMIPSFNIMGINPDYEVMAKKVQDYATAQLQQDGIHDLIIQLENILGQSCKELEEEYNMMKNIKK